MAASMRFVGVQQLVRLVWSGQTLGCRCPGAVGGFFDLIDLIHMLFFFAVFVFIFCENRGRTSRVGRSRREEEVGWI